MGGREKGLEREQKIGGLVLIVNPCHSQIILIYVSFTLMNNSIN